MIYSAVLTAPKRQVFSRSAPTLPIKPSIKVMLPNMMSTKAGSSAINVSLLILRNISFSIQAQMPMASTRSAVSQISTLLVKSKYLRQQLISLVSRRYLRTAGILRESMAATTTRLNYTKCYGMIMLVFSTITNDWVRFILLERKAVFTSHTDFRLSNCATETTNKKTCRLVREV